MFTRIMALIVKEFLQVFRDPRMKTTIFVAPVVQVLLFGFAATMDITNIPTAVYDLDNTKESRALIRDFAYSSYFDIKHYVYELDQGNALIDKSRVLGLLRFNRGYAKDLIGGRDAQVQLIVDGTDSNGNEVTSRTGSQWMGPRGAFIC